MQSLFVRASPSLRRRLAYAAAEKGEPTAKYARRLLERWAVDWSNDRGEAARVTVEDETGPFTSHGYPVSDATHRTIRLVAADLELSQSTVVNRILHHYTPHEVELLARAVAGGQDEQG